MRFLLVPKNCPLRICPDQLEDIRLPEQKPENFYTIQAHSSNYVMPKYLDVKLTSEEYTRFYFFDSGSYNAAFINFTPDQFKNKNFPPQPILLKIQIVSSKLDEADRAVRIFNEINSKALNDKAIDSNFFGSAKKFGNACLMPFIIGSNSTAKEIQRRAIQLHNEHQRSLVDAYVSGNCITEDNTHIVWIVDGGLIFNLGYDLEDNCVKPKSEVSYDAWFNESETNDRDAYHYAFENEFLSFMFPWTYKTKFSITRDLFLLSKQRLSIVLTTMALLYIQKNYSHIRDVSCLLENPTLISFFAAAYIFEIRDEYFFPEKDEKTELMNDDDIIEQSGKLINVTLPTEKREMVDQLMELILVDPPRAPSLKSPSIYKGSIIRLNIQNDLETILEAARQLNQKGATQIGLFYQTTQFRCDDILQDNLQSNVFSELGNFLQTDYLDLQRVIRLLPIPVCKLPWEPPDSDVVSKCLTAIDTFISQGGIIFDFSIRDKNISTNRQLEGQRYVVSETIDKLRNQTSIAMRQKEFLKRKMKLEVFMHLLYLADLIAVEIDKSSFSRVKFVDYSFDGINFNEVFNDDENADFLRMLSADDAYSHSESYLPDHIKHERQLNFLVDIRRNVLKREWFKYYMQQKNMHGIIPVALPISNEQLPLIQMHVRNSLISIYRLCQEYNDCINNNRSYTNAFGFFGYTVEEKLSAIKFFFYKLREGRGNLDEKELLKNKVLMEGRLGGAVEQILRLQGLMRNIAKNSLELVT